MIIKHKTHRQPHHCFPLLISLLLVLLNLSTLQPLQAGEQAEKAITSVRKLINSGIVQKDTAIKIMVKEGNINNFLGTDFQLKNEWEQKTSILIDIDTYPQVPVLEILSQKIHADLILARPNEFPDLVTLGYITHLTPFFTKYGFPLEELTENRVMLPGHQAWFDNKVVAIPTDGDIAVLYLRTDWLNDPINQEKFKKKYHHPLHPPRTWDEYQELVEFFYNPAAGIYGTCEERAPESGWMTWMPRYVSQANPNQYLFDEQMHPLIDSPEGIAATKNYLKTVPFSPPGILEAGHNYSFTMPLYNSGKCFTLIVTMAGAKVFNLDSSPIKGKFSCYLLPGTIIKDRLVRRTTFIYGNNIVIPQSSHKKDLAFLYAMWISDPDISIRSINVATGMSDPYRFNHLKNQEVRNIYTGACLDILGQIQEIAIPAGVGLPGNNEYLQALNQNLWLACQGKISARQAMKNTANQWEQITEKYGRNKQIYYWKIFKQLFPNTSEKIPTDIKITKNK